MKLRVYEGRVNSMNSRIGKLAGLFPQPLTDDASPDLGEIFTVSLEFPMDCFLICERFIPSS